MSFSKRSGVTGTDGWIAPEMFADNASVVRLFLYIYTNNCINFIDFFTKLKIIFSSD